MKQKLRRLGIKCVPNLKFNPGLIEPWVQSPVLQKNIYLKIIFKKLNRGECRGAWLPKMQRLSGN